MAFTLNRRLSTLVDSSGQINTGKIPNDYISTDHIADNVITTAMLHSGFTLPTSSLSSIDTDNITEGSTNLFYTDARVDSRLSGGTGVTYSSGTISIGQAVATSDSPTFADLTVTGNLNITGDINSYNVTDLDVTDQTITLGAGQIESNSGGSGIIIDGSNASILWDETNDQFDFNKGVNIDSNTLVVDGTNNRVGILNAAPDVSLDIGSSTDAIHMPVGTTAQRPSSPAAGYFRYNSDDGQFEGYTTEWGAIAGSGGSAMETNNFTGDGSTTAFTLSSTVASEDNLIVFIEGIYQNKGDYVASGTTITFTTAPVNGRRIVVQHILSSVSGNSTLYTSLSGDGSTTAFTLSGAPGHENNTQVFMDGVYQQKDSYIVNGTTLTFDAAPANGSSIEVMSFAQTTVNQPGSNTVSVAELNLSDGSSGQFITTDGNGTISFATALTSISANSIGITEINVSDGTNGQFLQTNGSGTLSFADAASAFADLTEVTVATSDPALNTNPSTGVGTLWLNKNTGNIWCCTDAATGNNYWTNIGKGDSDVGFVATGGNSTVTSGGYKYHVFTSSGNLVVTGSRAAQALIIGGGGGGGGTGANGGGGGGAGGVVLGSAITLTTQTYSITVGAGGAHGSTGSDGGNSSFPGETVAVGGGGGGSFQTNGRSGGSGGGGGRDSGTSSGGAGTSGQGNAGGAANGTSCASGGGGGGAGQVGQQGGTDCGSFTAGMSDGGDGTSTYSAWGVATSTGVDVSGTRYYAGGGGGAYEANAGANNAVGGLGGGGRGASGYTNPHAGTPGTANTGSGGGAGQHRAGINNDGGNGATGLVIVRYAV